MPEQDSASGSKAPLDDRPAVYEWEFAIQYHETDQYGFVRHTALLNFMQTASVEHAKLLGVSVNAMLKAGYTWVLSRVHLTITCYLRAGDTVRIRTWPALRTHRFTVRDFEIYDGAGTLIGTATTSWAVLDMATRRPALLGSVLPDFPLTPARALQDDFGTLPQLKNREREQTIPVLRSDLDSNRHVNNTVYVSWALEAIPDEIDRDFRLTSLEIGFKAEALYGDVIRTMATASAESSSCFIHLIENAADGRELARLRTCWEPKLYGY